MLPQTEQSTGNADTPTASEKKAATEVRQPVSTCTNLPHLDPHVSNGGLDPLISGDNASFVDERVRSKAIRCVGSTRYRPRG
jgi:hypothetical protein